jgi:hypothetical protein
LKLMAAGTCWISGRLAIILPVDFKTRPAQPP